MASKSAAGCIRVGRLFFEKAFTLDFAKVHRCQNVSFNFRNFASTESNAEKSETQEIDSKLSEIENLNKQLAESKEKYDSLEDKYKRALADGENNRLRFAKQLEDTKIFCIQKFCKDLLEVSDILQRATDSVPKEEISDKNPHLKSLYEGLTMTERELQSVFKRHGLVLVNPIDEKFDPNFHEALFQQDVDGKQPGTVVVVSKVGYKLNERVIRPALVGVAKGS